MTPAGRSDRGGGGAVVNLDRVTVVDLGLGSNVGRRRAQMGAALNALQSHSRIEVTAVSRLYETSPVGGPKGQREFLNAAATIEVDLSLPELLNLTQSIERELGRHRDVRHGPRTIDIDLLMAVNKASGEAVVHDVSPRIPHPRMHERAFVLVPLADIAASRVHPGLGRNVGALLHELSYEGKCRLADAAWWEHRCAVRGPQVE